MNELIFMLLKVNYDYKLHLLVTEINSYEKLCYLHGYTLITTILDIGYLIHDL